MLRSKSAGTAPVRARRNERAPERSRTERERARRVKTRTQRRKRRVRSCRFCERRRDACCRGKSANLSSRRRMVSRGLTPNRILFRRQVVLHGLFGLGARPASCSARDPHGSGRGSTERTQYLSGGWMARERERARRRGFLFQKGVPEIGVIIAIAGFVLGRRAPRARLALALQFRWVLSVGETSLGRGRSSVC